MFKKKPPMKRRGGQAVGPTAEGRDKWIFFVGRRRPRGRKTSDEVTRTNDAEPTEQKDGEENCRAMTAEKNSSFTGEKRPRPITAVAVDYWPKENARNFFT